MSKISDMDCINICATKMSTPRHFTAFCCRDTPNAPAWRPATEPQNTMFLFFNFQFIFLFCLFLFPSLSCWSNLKQIRFLKKKKKKVIWSYKSRKMWLGWKRWVSVHSQFNINKFFLSMSCHVNSAVRGKGLKRGETCVLQQKKKKKRGSKIQSFTQANRK